MENTGGRVEAIGMSIDGMAAYKAELMEAANVAWLKFKGENAEAIEKNCEGCLRRTFLVAFMDGKIWGTERQIAKIEAKGEQS